MREKIVIIGGYGSVGRHIAIELGDRFPGKVIAAGRDNRKAQQLSESTRGKVLPLEMNVFDPDADAMLPDDTKLVIMCLDLPNAEFVRKCIRRGIHYIDISASYELLSQIELLDAEAKEHKSTVVLSVGLAPGLTNLLTAYCKSKLEHIERADIFILLGLGEAHGEAALRWTIENMERSFSDSKSVVFSNGIGARKTYRFNFSDQHVLPRTLKIPSVSTWLCFDSVLATQLFAFFKKLEFFALLHFKTVRELLVKIFRTFHFGSDVFSVRVEALGKVKGVDTCYAASISGHGEARCTAAVTSEVATQLVERSLLSGVFHIEQLFNLEEMISKLESKGMSFKLD